MVIHAVPRPDLDKPSKRKLKAPPQTGLGAHLRGLAAGYEKMAKVTGAYEDVNTGCARGLQQAADLVDATLADQVGAAHVMAVLDLVRQVTGALVEAAEQVREAAADIASSKADGTALGIVPASSEIGTEYGHAVERVVRRARAPRPAPRAPSGGLPAGEFAVLEVVCQHPQGVTRQLITLATGYKRSTRDAYVSRLVKDHGESLVEATADDRIVATPAGRGKMPAGFKPIPKSPAAMREHYLSTLPGGEVDVFRLLIAHPSGLSREDVHKTTGYAISTSNAYVARLLKRLIVEESGKLVRVKQELVRGSR